MRRAIALLVAAFLLPTEAQKSFANTRFELSDNLPFEDSLGGPVRVSADHDAPPQEVVKPQLPPVTPTPLASSTFALPTFPAVSFPTMPTISFPPMPVFTAPPPAIPSFPPPAFGAPAPGVAAPQVVVPALPTLPPLPSPSVVVPSTIAAQRPESLAPIQVKAAKVATTKARKNVPTWFVEDFDVSECAKKPEFIAQQFARKFPHRALTKDKVTTFENFLALRLKECQRKEAANHWDHIERSLRVIRISAIEEDECRSGLLQEKIACSNMHSYSCQFAQKSFRFRSQPAKTIIQEARLAEDGAEKCRKIVKVIKKRIEQKSRI